MTPVKAWSLVRAVAAWWRLVLSPSTVSLKEFGSSMESRSVSRLNRYTGSEWHLREPETSAWC